MVILMPLRDMQDMEARAYCPICGGELYEYDEDYCPRCLEEMNERAFD